MAFGTTVTSRLSYSPPVWPWVSKLTSLRIGFLTCGMGRLPCKVAVRCGDVKCLASALLISSELRNPQWDLLKYRFWSHGSGKGPRGLHFSCSQVIPVLLISGLGLVGRGWCSPWVAYWNHLGSFSAPPPPQYGLVKASVLPRWRSYKEALSTVGEWVCLVRCLVGRLPLVYRTKLSSAPSSSSPVQISWVKMSSSGIFKRDKSVSPVGFVSNWPLLMRALSITSIEKCNA